MAEKTFKIKCTMEERWIPHFLTMLQVMEHNGNIGHSGVVAFMSDGDGDFRPKFKSNIEFNVVSSKSSTQKPEYFFDAS